MVVILDFLLICSNWFRTSSCWCTASSPTSGTSPALLCIDSGTKTTRYVPLSLSPSLPSSLPPLSFYPFFTGASLLCFCGTADCVEQCDQHALRTLHDLRHRREARIQQTNHRGMQERGRGKRRGEAKGEEGEEEILIVFLVVLERQGEVISPLPWDWPAHPVRRPLRHQTWRSLLLVLYPLFILFLPPLATYLFDDG